MFAFLREEAHLNCVYDWVSLEIITGPEKVKTVAKAKENTK